MSGREYIKYGGDTTCIEVRTKSDDIIIIDAGTGIRRLGNQLISEERFRYHILFTHAHWDHLIGFPFFKPLFNKKSEIIAYRCPFPGKYVEKMIAKILAPPNFPVKYADLSARIVYTEGCPEPIQIGSVTIHSIPLSHPNGGAGYKIIEDDRTFVFLTDNELGFRHSGGLDADSYLAFAKDADLLIHDAEYTPREYQTQIEWGHSAYDQVIDLAHAACVKKLGLFHLNQERSDQAMDDIVAECRSLLKEKKSAIECFAVGCDMAFTL